MTEHRIAFTGANLIDGNGGGANRGGWTADEVRVPPDAECIAVDDKTIMPGMIDCHLHPLLSTRDFAKNLSTARMVHIFRTAQILKRTLHAGFTTIRTAGELGDPGMREVVDRLVEGPRMVMAGTVSQTGGQWHFISPGGIELPLLEGIELGDGVAGVQRAARIQLRKGFDFIKVASSGDNTSPAGGPETTEYTVEELKAIVAEAAARGKAVMAHAYCTQGIKNALQAGVWSVEHGSLLDVEAIEMFLDTGAYLVPTLFIAHDILTRGEEMGQSAYFLEKSKIDRHDRIESFRKAAAAGVKIGVGTDIMDEVSHGKNAKELAYMVQYGLTPMQAIVAATRTSAEVCRIADRVGTLEADKLADLVVVEGNSLKDITVLQDPEKLLVVMKEGKQYVNRID